MAIHRLLLILTAIAIPTFALPAHVARDISSSQDNTSLFASIAVVLAVFLFLFILAVLKRVYRRKRRADGPEKGASIDSLTPSSASFLPSVYSFASRNPSRQAFFVGLFGSPSFEIENATHSNHIEKGSSYNESHRTRSTARRSGSQENFLASEFGAYDTFSHASNHSSPLYDMFTTTGHRVHADIPAHPPKVQTIPSTTSNLRRHSLPASSSKDPFMSVISSHRKRHSSLKSTRSNRRSRHSVSFFSGNGSIDPTRRSSRSSDKESISPAIYTATPRSHRHSVITLPPLPALPRMATPAPSRQDNTPSGHGFSFISHPYAQAPRQKRESYGRPKFTIGPIPPGQALEAALDFISMSPEVPVSKAEFQSPAPERRKSRSSAPPAFTPLAISPVSPMSPSLDSFPFPPVPVAAAATLPRAKPKPKRSSLRSRRSPSIGPSPLRIMTLPEPSLANLASVADSWFKASQENIPESAFSSSKPTYGGVGQGRPSERSPGRFSSTSTADPSPDDDDETPKPTQDQKLNGYPRISSATDVDDSNGLLGMIKELVEETSQWDPTLYSDMNDNFKSMLRVVSGGVTPSTSKKEDLAATAGSNLVFKRLSPPQSVEFDLGLYELDSRYLHLKALEEQNAVGQQSSARMSFLDDEAVGVAW